ncbi:MAG: hypothetical protein AAGF98_08375 [Cyanobacteria bacterium P01_H01_bin.153]
MICSILNWPHGEKEFLWARSPRQNRQGSARQKALSSQEKDDLPAATLREHDFQTVQA